MKPWIIVLLFIFYNITILSDADPQDSRNYLALISVNNYLYWQPLGNPLSDARALRDVLVKNYEIDEVFQCFDTNATKKGITRFFSYLESRMTPGDTLIIFFAGHGIYDKDTQIGYLIPQDGGSDRISKSNWLSQFELQRFIKKLSPNNILLLLDACFSGSMISPLTSERSSNTEELTSRIALTAGGLESVADESIFTRTMITELLRNTAPGINISRLYRAVSENWTHGNPQIGIINDTGHQDGGDFTLVLKKDIAPENWGSLLIKTDTPCDLYIDEDFYSHLEEELLISRLKQREVTVEMKYPGGFNHKARVFIIAGRQKIHFPYLVNGENKIKKRWELSGAAGAAFPAGYFFQWYYPGIFIDLEGSGQFVHPPFTFQAGISSGLYAFHSNDNNLFSGWFLSIPLHLVLKGMFNMGQESAIGLGIGGGRSLIYLYGNNSGEGDCWSLNPELFFLITLPGGAELEMDMGTGFLFLEQIYMTINMAIQINFRL